MGPPILNGRVDLLSPFSGGAWLGGAPEASGPNPTLNREALKGVFSATPLSDLFFSPLNVEALHQGARYKVFTATGTVVGRQSDAELATFMRATFLREARYDATDVVAQVRALNASVLAQVVANVVTNLTQWQAYRVDVSHLPVPLAKGLYTSRAGTKIVEQRHPGIGPS